MKHSYGPKLFLAAAFALTLGLKLFFYPAAPRMVDSDVLGEVVSTFLINHGFETRLEKRFGNFLIYGNAGKCRGLIGEAEPQRWNQGSIELLARPVGRVTYVFEGTVHGHQPFFAPMLAEYWTRVRMKMGLSPKHRPLLAVAASDECVINALPSWEVGVVS